MLQCAIDIPLTADRSSPATPAGIALRGVAAALTGRRVLVHAVAKFFFCCHRLMD